MDAVKWVLLWATKPGGVQPQPLVGGERPHAGGWGTAAVTAAPPIRPQAAPRGATPRESALGLSPRVAGPAIGAICAAEAARR